MILDSFWEQSRSKFVQNPGSEATALLLGLDRIAPISFSDDAQLIPSVLHGPQRVVYIHRFLVVQSRSQPHGGGTDFRTCSIQSSYQWHIPRQNEA
jgi:hypothetical protein